MLTQRIADNERGEQTTLPLSAVIDENKVAISQLLDLLTTLPDDLYRRPIGARGQHFLGKHIRHIIDHYDAFFTVLEDPSHRPVNYDARAREPGLERNPAVAIKRLNSLCDALNKLQTAHQDRLVNLDCVCDQGVTTLTSSLGRELMFLSSHCIHHMAIIGLLVEQNGGQVGAQFGVHPATLRHQRNLQSAATA